ncbi:MULTISPECIES: anthranilate synthase component I [unclassified Enterococcus]|uniref:anthranilate synthase component I n=1 Tax=unclassified Enterococcus TaxID=2608891 RepID=UPI001CE225F3|nr:MULTISPECIES: anthranilate synthase component I [unclassified Enterococcus]MCA5013607.1 anthranilate synthase component I [Enterococcus sp. S23]MCA5016857.1 anthranilate synthase component I [Enterococcus sp. S22(2020)]
MQLIKEIQADYLTAVSAFLRIKGKNKCLLESIPRDKSKGRYSIIAWDAVTEITYTEKQLTIASKTITTHEPLKEIEKYVLKNEEIEADLPFQGGAIGYVGYDVVACYEDLGELPLDEMAIPDIHFYLFDSYLIFDHVGEKISLVEANTYSNRSVKELEQALQQKKDELQIPSEAEQKDIQLTPLNYQSNFTKESFEQVVNKVKEYIRQGDLFQMVPSQRLKAEFKGVPFDYYRRLRVTNPSMYLYFLDFGETYVVGSSPESLVSVKDGIVTTNPIAGTRKRGKTIEQDAVLEKELINDEKERAEHLMLIDLGRNDVGRVSEIGSVEVPVYMTVEKYRFVMHIVSVVTGRLKAELSAMDALKVTLPAGTVSGAPKIRAMQRIYELEPVKRNIYAGAVGYLSKNDQADFAIAIRTMVIHKGIAYVQAGAGIVHDSDPAKEYEETLQKAKALLEVSQ